MVFVKQIDSDEKKRTANFKTTGKLQNKTDRIKLKLLTDKSPLYK